MKVLNKVKKINNNSGNISKIVLFNNKKFRIFAELRNGGNSIYAQIMNLDGEFKFVLNNTDLDFEYSASYVSQSNIKENDLVRAICEMEILIKKVYK